MRASIAAVAVIVLAGCNPKDRENLATDTQSLVKHAGEAAGSASVAARVNTALSLRKGVSMSGLQVDAEGGTVTLSGTVRNAEERDRILETVNNTRGVEKVVDKMETRK